MKNEFLLETSANSCLNVSTQQPMQRRSTLNRANLQGGVTVNLIRIPRLADNLLQKFGFIKRVDKGEITTVKDLES